MDSVKVELARLAALERIAVALERLVNVYAEADACSLRRLQLAEAKAPETSAAITPETSTSAASEEDLL